MTFNTKFLNDIDKCGAVCYKVIDNFDHAAKGDAL